MASKHVQLIAVVVNVINVQISKTTGAAYLPTVAICQHHRSGPLCSTCECTYNLSYDAYKCVKWTSIKIIGFPLTCVGFLRVVLQVIFIVQLRFHIGSGYAYSVLYFFTIICYIVWYNIPDYPDVVMNVFTTFARFCIISSTLAFASTLEPPLCSMRPSTSSTHLLLSQPSSP